MGFDLLALKAEFLIHWPKQSSPSKWGAQPGVLWPVPSPHTWQHGTRWLLLSWCHCSCCAAGCRGSAHPAQCLQGCRKRKPWPEAHLQPSVSPVVLMAVTQECPFPSTGALLMQSLRGVHLFPHSSTSFWYQITPADSKIHLLGGPWAPPAAQSCGTHRDVHASPRTIHGWHTPAYCPHLLLPTPCHSSQQSTCETAKLKSKRKMTLS